MELLVVARTETTVNKLLQISQQHREAGQPDRETLRWTNMHRCTCSHHRGSSGEPSPLMLKSHQMDLMLLDILINTHKYNVYWRLKVKIRPVGVNNAK